MYSKSDFKQDVDHRTLLMDHLNLSIENIQQMLGQYWPCEALVTLKKINIGIDRKIQQKKTKYVYFSSHRQY